MCSEGREKGELNIWGGRRCGNAGLLATSRSLLLSLKLEKWPLWSVLDGGEGAAGGLLVWTCLYCRSLD